jgi:hypothetical protein
MDNNTSLQQFVESSNELNRYLFYFPEEYPRKLDQDEIIEILDHAKAVNHERYEMMVNAIAVIFEMSYEELISYIKLLENLENSGTPMV